MKKMATPVALLLLAASGCTDVRLWKPGSLERVSVELERPEPEEPDHTWGFVAKPGEVIRYKVGDVFCTPPSLEVTVPFKLVVIMDYSGSMNDNDGDGVRIDAVAALVNQYRGDPAVHFAFLRFATALHELPDLGKEFTNNPARLDGAIQTLRQQNTFNPGGTNYQASLEWAWEAIDMDMRREDNVPGTRYGILFVTDGNPNDPENGANDAQNIALNRPKIEDRITGVNGWKAHQPLNTMIEFLNTYFISEFPDADATLLLQDMARWGKGDYFEVNDVNDLEFDLDLPTLRKVFVNRSGFIFFNHHVKATFRNREMVMARDSDGDGLPDFLESANPDPNDPHASSMFSADTDGNGIGDLVGWSLGAPTNEANPAAIYERPPPAPELAAAGMLTAAIGAIEPSEHDTDGDGLTNDEERFLGTEPTMVDTDRDGLSDYVELRFQLNPLEPSDAALDGDGDGFDSKTEVETGMDPHHIEPEWFRERYALRIHRGDEIEQEIPNPGGLPRVRTCYEFRVDNILYRAPLRPDGSQGGLNLFELSFIDQTRVPIGESEFVSRRITTKAVPQDDRPGFYFQRSLPEHW